MFELFACERLSAKISAASCRGNKSRGVFACEGCRGLGAAVTISVEDVDMAQKQCKVEMCTKMSQHGMGGMCKSHFHGSTPRPSKPGPLVVVDTPKPWAAPVSKVEATTLPVVPEVEQVAEAVDVPESFGMVTNGDGAKVSFGVDEVIWLALEEAFQAKKNEWMVELSGMKPGAAICRCAQMIHAAESLGY